MVPPWDWFTDSTQFLGGRASTGTSANDVDPDVVWIPTSRKLQVWTHLTQITCGSLLVSHLSPTKIGISALAHKKAVQRVLTTTSVKIEVFLFHVTLVPLFILLWLEGRLIDRKNGRKSHRLDRSNRCQKCVCISARRSIPSCDLLRVEFCEDSRSVPSSSPFVGLYSCKMRTYLCEWGWKFWMHGRHERWRRGRKWSYCRCHS